jgi:hypothetical protein
MLSPYGGTAWNSPSLVTKRLAGLCLSNHNKESRSMPTITVTFSVTSDELEALRMGKCDKPDPERMKHMLLAAARSNVRNLFARIDEARNEKRRWLADDNVAKLKALMLKRSTAKHKTNHADHSSQPEHN